MNDTLDNINKLIDQSQYFESIRLLEEFHASEKDNQKIIQLLALAYSRSGSIDKALEFFRPFYLENPSDPETSGIMGGIYKRLFQKYQDQHYARQAAEIYSKNFEITHNYYPGINAASMLFMVSKNTQGKKIARAILENIDPDDGDVWVMATIGEAYLLLKDYSKSEQYYVKARKLLKSDWGIMSSVHKQLWLLNHYIRVPKNIMSLFSPPEITVFTGHMIDHPSRETPRFTPSMEDPVREMIESAISSLDVQVAYTSLACGADILFAEAMEKAGRTIKIIIPFKKEDYIRESVGFAGKDWVDRFESILLKITPEYISEEEFNGSDECFDLMSKILLGKSRIHAEKMGSKINLLTVMSQSSLNKKTGGTRSMYDIWPEEYSTHNLNTDPFVPKNPEESKVVQIEPVNYNSNLKLSFSVSIKFKNTEQSGEYMNIIEDFLSDNSASWYSQYSKENILILFFKTEVISMEFILFILKYQKAKKIEDLSFSLPFIFLDADLYEYEKTPATPTITLSDPKKEQLVKLLNLFKEQGIIASENFACLLVIRENDLKTDYFGQIKSGGKFLKIYKVSRKMKYI